MLGLSAFIALLDQGIKWWMTQFLSYGESKTVIPGLFDLSLVHNTGGAFGLFARHTFVFILLSVVTILFLLLFYRQYRISTPSVVWPVGLVLGGAVGNLIDRVRLGYVIDFFDFYAGPYHWPAFNIADSGICIGLAVLAFHIGKK